MGETIYYDEWKKQVKKEEFKRKAVEFGQKTLQFMKDYGPVCVAVVGAATTCVVKISNNHTRRIVAKEQHRHDARTLYDKRKGHYCEVKRDLKGSDWITIDKRYENGESYSEILNDMNLLK